MTKKTSWWRALGSTWAARSLVVSAFIVFLLARGITKGEPFFHAYDEPRHTMNGVFFRDALFDLPVSHPVRYAQEYYSKYPAIAMPHWPPFFPFVEGILFSVFGISVWASRLAVLGFALLAFYFWYRIAERFGPRSRALVSALIFCLLPVIMIYETVVMLEIPQLALCLGAIYFWLRWRENERQRDLWAFCGFVVAAMLTDQAAVFLALFLLLDFLLGRRFRLLRSWQPWLALLASLAFVVPWYLFTMKALPHTLQRGAGHNFHHLIRLLPLIYYPLILPFQLGVVLLVLACIGVTWTLLRGSHRYRFLLLWILSAYVCFTLIAEKGGRHIFIWLPPLVYFALIGIEILLPRGRRVGLAHLVLVLYFVVRGVAFQRPYLRGAEPTARFVLSQPKSDLVYYQGMLDADFIFQVRRFDPQKSHMIVRGLQVGPNAPDFAGSHVSAPDLFRTWGIQYAVIAHENSGPAASQVKQDFKSPDFDLIASFPIQANYAFTGDDNPDIKFDPNVGTFDVYRYRGEIERGTWPLSIPLSSIQRSFPVDLRRLAGRPWPN